MCLGKSTPGLGRTQLLHAHLFVQARRSSSIAFPQPSQCRIRMRHPSNPGLGLGGDTRIGRRSTPFSRAHPFFWARGLSGTQSPRHARIPEKDSQTRNLCCFPSGCVCLRECSLARACPRSGSAAMLSCLGVRSIPGDIAYRAPLPEPRPAAQRSRRPQSAAAPAPARLRMRASLLPLVGLAAADFNGTCPADGRCPASAGTGAGDPCCQFADTLYDCCFSGEGCIKNVGCRCPEGGERCRFDAWKAEHRPGGYASPAEDAARFRCFEQTVAEIGRLRRDDPGHNAQPKSRGGGEGGLFASNSNLRISSSTPTLLLGCAQRLGRSGG